MPPTPFSPPPASPCPPTTAANHGNLILCTPTPSEDTETKIEKSSNKHKSKPDARHHPYGRPNCSKASENSAENDLRNIINFDLTPSQKEVFERCLEAAVQDPAPHLAANFRQPVDVKPNLPSLMDLPPNLPSQAKNMAPNMNPSSIMWDHPQQPRQYSEAVQRNLPKREIVLDGLNIGKVYGRSKFSALGVEKTLTWFTSRGFKVRVFMPKSRKDRANAKADQRRLNKMISQGDLILTPSRRSDGALWTSFDCNEEDYIVRYAAQREAVIVSTRRFADYNEATLQAQVETRVLVFTFSDKEFDPPMDPRGRDGPSLEEFLHFPSNNHHPVEKLQEAKQQETDLFKRSIIIDGSNVGHGFTGNARFDVKGIEKCLEYFLERGHEVKVYIAASMMEKREVSEHDRKKLRKLCNEGKLVFTPSRKTSFQSYDCYEDDFIIRNAIKTQGIIVSNDYFLDMIARSPDYREQIEKRLLPFNFIDGELWLPSDPLGKNQVSLETFLHRPMLPPTELMLELNPYLTLPRQTCTDPDIPREILDILNTPQGGASNKLGPGDDESDSEDGWRAAFYQTNDNCVYIDYNKSLNPDQ